MLASLSVISLHPGAICRLFPSFPVLVFQVFSFRSFEVWWLARIREYRFESRPEQLIHIQPTFPFELVKELVSGEIDVLPSSSSVLPVFIRWFLYRHVFLARLTVCLCSLACSVCMPSSPNLSIFLRSNFRLHIVLSYTVLYTSLRSVFCICIFPSFNALFVFLHFLCVCVCVSMSFSSNILCSFF